MTDKLGAVLRTALQAIIAYGVSILAKHNIHISEQQQLSISVVATPVVSAVQNYLEHLGWLKPIFKTVTTQSAASN